MTPAARVVFDTLKDVESHAMDPEEYHLKELKRRVVDTDELAGHLENQAGLEIFEGEVPSLAIFLKAREFDLNAEDAKETLLGLLMSSGESNPLPRFERAFRLYDERQSALVELAVELEARFADSYLRYTRDVYHSNLNRFSDVERERYDVKFAYGALHPKYRNEIILRRLFQELNDFARLDGAESARAHVEALLPVHEQYDRLRESFARYKKIVADGGWKEVKPVPLNFGGRGPTVTNLKKRLTIEGYYTGLIDDHYNADLKEALRLYQTTHQLEVSGEIASTSTSEGRSLWGSINTPAQTRLKQIEVNLQRWRKSRMLRSDHYVYINIPDFHAEVWQNSERKKRFKIVVGASTRKCNPSTRKIDFVNATPLQHARLDRVVFNPYWNVPPRIEREEYWPLIQEDSKWLEKSNFEYFDAADGRVLRQKPGTMNALGQVKFIFPNSHNTYMHDTPKKGLFQYPIRAFSHGCIRVHEPMKLARYLVEGENKWNQIEINRAQRAAKEYPTFLDEPLDVFVEYYTTRVAEDGRVHFLADVYRLVHDEMNPNNPYRKDCVPQNSQTLSRSDVLKGDGFGP